MGVVMENGGQGSFLGFSTGNVITMFVHPPPPTPHSICSFGPESQRAGAALGGCAVAAVAVEDCDKMW
jgi:hypothetical protein